MTTTSLASRLHAYVPRLPLRWTPTGDRRPSPHAGRGTLAFVDICGYTALTEPLGCRDEVGAERISDVLNATFAGLLTEVRADDADLVTWGGEAVLLLYQGLDHALRAARSAHRMRSALHTLGRISTSSVAVTLRMSMGPHRPDRGQRHDHRSAPRAAAGRTPRPDPFAARPRPGSDRRPGRAGTHLADLTVDDVQHHALAGDEDR